jgi:type IV secretory pathway protease TraF
MALPPLIRRILPWKRRRAFQEALRNILLMSAPFVMALLLSFSLPAIWFRLNLTPSMPVGIYRLVSGPISAGDLVVFPNPRTDIVQDRQLLKEVVSIEDGMMTVRGHHPRSFDSRVFGAVPIASGKKVVPFMIPEKWAP